MTKIIKPIKIDSILIGLYLVGYCFPLSMAKKSKDIQNIQHIAYLKSIGRGLKKLRTEKGFSNYYDLSHDIEMTPSQYGAYENGQNFTILTLLKILSFHEISLKEFLNKYVD